MFVVKELSLIQMGALDTIQLGGMNKLVLK